MHGWGVYACDDMPVGALVLEYVGELVGNAAADRRERVYEADGTGTLYLFRLDAHAIVDATKAGGIARYVNHSCAPNCTTRIVKEPCGTKHIAIVALRDIARGEELCYDYQMEFEPEGPVLACACGAPSCRGRMN